MTTIYVGNLPFSANEADVRVLFERYGKVDSVKLVNDRETGRPRGFGFVDMPAAEAQAAIAALNGYDMNGRALRINEARPASAALRRWRWIRWRRWRWVWRRWWRIRWRRLRPSLINVCSLRAVCAQAT